MKRFFAFTLAIVMIAALLCACGEENSTSGSIQTTVAAKYDDGYAEQFADSVTTDESGNKVYNFSDGKYDSYIASHNNSLSKDIQDMISANHEAGFGEYSFIDDEKQAVVIGVHEGKYDAAAAEAEAAAAAEYGFQYFQSLKTPVNTIRVIYCDVNNQSVEYGSFQFTAE